MDDKKDASPAEVRDAIAAKLKAGADFVELARRWSDFGAADGGWWHQGGYTVEADLVEKTWRDALAKLKPGECTIEPVVSADGTKWVFLKLEDRREKIHRPLDEDKVPEDLVSRARDQRMPPPMRVSDDLRVRLRQEQLLSIWKEEMARLRSKAYIGRYDEDLILAGLRRRFNELK